MKKFHCLIIIFLLFYPFKLIFSQNQNEVGRPFMTTFTAKEHPGDLQTWAFVQDSRGVIYAGNQPAFAVIGGVQLRVHAAARHANHPLQPGTMPGEPRREFHRAARHQGPDAV